MHDRHAPEIGILRDDHQTLAGGVPPDGYVVGAEQAGAADVLGSRIFRRQ